MSLLHAQSTDVEEMIDRAQRVYKVDVRSLRSILRQSEVECGLIVNAGNVFLAIDELPSICSAGLPITIYVPMRWLEVPPHRVGVMPAEPPKQLAA